MQKIDPENARYIKLGPGGTWERRCLEEGTLRFGYLHVPHDLALQGDREALIRFLMDHGDNRKTAASHAGQIIDFYQLPDHTLWITFSSGSLWWCFAKPGVEFLNLSDEEAEKHGSRLRRCLDGWHNTSINGQLLYMNELNGALTRVAAFRGTICKVRLFDYLVRKINDEDLPEITRARKAQSELLASIPDLMGFLNWKDFELLVDLIFSASGWRRIGESGGTQKTVDMELELPSTGERAFVQVKSETNQAQLDDYLEHFAGRDEGRMFYVYHTAKSALQADNPDVSLIGPARLSSMVLDAGLFGWLLRKAG